jgi:hypothetical protein
VESNGVSEIVLGVLVVNAQPYPNNGQNRSYRFKASSPCWLSSFFVSFVVLARDFFG